MSNRPNPLIARRWADYSAERFSMNKSQAIEVDIDRALDFLEQQFTNPEQRWGELRSLIAKQKAAQPRVQRTAGTECKHERHETVWHCLDCGEYV